MITRLTFRVLFVVLAALALTALVASANDLPAPQKELPAVYEKGESASPAATAFESEPNNSFATADLMLPFELMAGTIASAGDIDVFHVLNLDDYGVYSPAVDIDAYNSGSALDAVICIYDHAQVQLACSDDSDGLDPFLYVFSMQDEDDYFITVRDYSANEGGPSYTYNLSVYGPTFVSPAAKGSVGGVAFQAGDILAHTDFSGYSEDVEKWMLFFDASDVGVTKNTSGIEVWTTGAAMSFATNQVIVAQSGASFTATPFDIVQFNATQWGPSTQGSFAPAMLLDGSTVGLSATSEKIDALTLTYSGRWGISTTGAAAVPSAAGGTLKARDEDIIELNATTGKWALVFDGSTVPGMAVEDVIAADFDGINGIDWLTLFIKGTGRLNGYPVTQKQPFYYYPDWPEESDAGGSFPFNVDGYSRRN